MAAPDDPTRPAAFPALPAFPAIATSAPDSVVMASQPQQNPNACKFCGDDRQVEWSADGCYCNTCGRAWP